MKTLKETFKALAIEQPQLKNQRKSVYIIGERTMTPRQAWFKHQQNRLELYAMYSAYAILQGQPCEVEPMIKKKVEAYVEQFKDNIK